MLYNSIKTIYPNITDEEFVLRDNGEGPYIHIWNSTVYPQPTDQQIADASKLASIADVTAKIKEIATSKILTIAPLYKQNNMLAEGLNAIVNNDAEKLAELQGVWDRINAIRARSNQLETSLEGNPDLDITQGWPE